MEGEGTSSGIHETRSISCSTIFLSFTTDRQSAQAPWPSDVNKGEGDDGPDLPSNFGDVLGDFASEIPLADSPSNWLHASLNYIHKTAQKLPELSNDRGVVDLENITLTYPHFSLYTLVHLERCVRNQSLIRMFWEKQARWTALDEITQLSDHQRISHTLWYLLAFGSSQDYSSNLSRDLPTHLHPCYCRERIDRLIKLDIMGIVARVLSILYDIQRRGLLLNQRDGRAQSLLDLLQALLDVPYLDSSIRSPITSAMFELAKRSARYPKCLHIRGVTVESDYVVDSGGFGEISWGDLGGRRVALKVMKVCSNDTYKKVISREAVLWRQLAHPNVLPFYGVFDWNNGSGLPRTCLVSPWMVNGNIVEHLKLHPDSDLWSLSLDVTLGLEYLHSFNPHVIHGDLKGMNILITLDKRACLADFGLGTLVRDFRLNLPSTSSTHGQGSIHWFAPEIIQGKPKTPASDMYAFGCVLHEIFAGHSRWHNRQRYEVIPAILSSKLPPRPHLHHRPDTLVDDFTWDLMVKCWSEVPDDRPAASEAVRLITLQMEPRTPDNSMNGWDEPLPDHSRSYLGEQPDWIKKSIDSFNPSHYSMGRHWVPGLDITNYSTPSREDLIIILFGLTGAGKSSFINTAMGYAAASVSDGLHSCTQDIGSFNYFHPTIPDRRVVFVDTPGFDNTMGKDSNIVRHVATWLKQTYNRKITSTGILLLHSISGSKLRRTLLKDLQEHLLQELGGQVTLKNVALVTTVWDQMPEATRPEHEDQLSTELWQPIISRGSRMLRFDSSLDSAWRIIDQFDIPDERHLDIGDGEHTSGSLPKTAMVNQVTRFWRRTTMKGKT